MIGTRQPDQGRGVAASILDAIGKTPLMEVEGIYVKLEYLNPSGSIKARIAKYMIERAEDEGLLRRGDTIVEATSFVGPSSGANLLTARRVCESYPELKNVVTLFCDEGEKYISEHFAEREGEMRRRS